MTGPAGPGDAEGTPAEWPVELRGVTESVVATRGPNGRWNLAALGLFAPGRDSADGAGNDSADDARTGEGDDRTGGVTARTWGDTRTRRNFAREGGGVVQFTPDPRDFVDAALDVREADDPVLDSADAWVEVRVERVDSGAAGDTRWERWRLRPTASEVRWARVPTINRGFNAVVEATVAASRLDVPAYDEGDLLDRLAFFAETVDACGGPAERAAFERLTELTRWRERRE